LIAPNTTITLVDNIIRVAPRASGVHHPADILFTSVAQDRADLAIGIVLSGETVTGCSASRRSNKRAESPSLRSQLPLDFRACHRLPSIPDALISWNVRMRLLVNSCAWCAIPICASDLCNPANLKTRSRRRRRPMRSFCDASFAGCAAPMALISATTSVAPFVDGSSGAWPSRKRIILTNMRCSSSPTQWRQPRRNAAGIRVHHGGIAAGIFLPVLRKQLSSPHGRSRSRSSREETGGLHRA